MGTNIYFDIAAIVQVCSIMLYSLRRKNFETKKRSIINQTFVVMLAALGLEIFLQAANTYQFIHAPIRAAFAIIKWIFYFAALLLFLRNLFVQSEDYVYASSVQKLKTAIPFALSILLSATSPFTHFLFYYDSDGVYQRGNAYFVVYIFIAYIFFMIVYELVRNRKNISSSIKVVNISFIVVILAAVILEYIFPDLLLVLFSTVIGYAMMYFVAGNQDRYMDADLHVLNREAFEETLVTEFSMHSSFQVLSLQMTGLSFIADYLGNRRVDAVRKMVAKRLREMTENVHPVYYIGHERFAIIANTDWSIWNRYISEIEQFFSQRFLVDGMLLEVNAGKCMISCPEYAKNPQELKDMIVLTLSESLKKNKRDVVYPSEESIKKGERERAIILALQSAIRDGSMEVYYQPIYNMEKKKYDSAKALLRMTNDSMGEISPLEFIPIAEKSGLMADIEKFIFSETCRLVCEQHLEELGLETIYINLSSLSCMQEDLAYEIEPILKEYPLHNIKLGFEVSEDIANSAGTIFERNMKALTKLGLFLCLDATDSGYANVHMLRKYKFDYVKISRNLIWEMLAEKETTDALVHIMRLLRQLDCRIIAEGVENEDQVNTLSRMDADYLQGFYYSKPIRAAQWAEFMKNKNFKGE